MVIIDIKIIMAIIVVMTVIFVMAVYCLCHNGCNINVYCLLDIMIINRSGYLPDRQLLSKPSNALP